MKALAAAALALLTSVAGAAPIIQNFGVTINTGSNVYPGNVLFVDCGNLNPDAMARAYLINQTGTLLETWHTGSFQWLAKPTGTDGSLVAFHQGGSGDTACGGRNGYLHLGKISPANKLTNLYYDPKCHLTHDYEVLQDGTFLILCAQLVNDPTVSTKPIVDNIIRKIDASGNVTWSWSTNAHFSQLGLSKAAQQIIMAGQTYYTSADENSPDPYANVYHTNNIQIIPANPSAASNPAFTPGNILVSQRNSNLIYVIDPSTGNVVWHIDNISVGQHHVRMIPTGLPGAGHLLLVNNGGYAGYPPITRPYSTIDEYDPIAKKLVWRYTSVSPNRVGFFAEARGSAQRLPNGNTFIDEAPWGRFFEVDANGNIVWEYVHEFGAGTPNPNADDRVIYRAYKVEACWPGCFAESTMPDGTWTW